MIEVATVDNEVEDVRRSLNHARNTFQLISSLDYPDSSR